VEVSVVIPTYNRAHVLGRALESVLPQCGPGDEVIIVDDGSTDSTEVVVGEYGQRSKNIKYIKVAHGGAGRARNIGMRLAAKPLVAFLDSDDEWMLGKMELQRSFMINNPDVVYSFGDIAVRFRDGTTGHFYVTRKWNHKLIDWASMCGEPRRFSSLANLTCGMDDFDVYIGDFYPFLMRYALCSPCTAIIRKASLNDTIVFAEDLPIYEDWEFFGRLARVGNGAYFARELIWNHVDGGARLTGADFVTKCRTRIDMLARVWGMDGAFLARHRDLFEKENRRQHVRLVKALLSGGEMQAARRVLEITKDPPWSLYILARLPRPALRTIIDCVRFFKRIGREVGLLQKEA